MTVKIYVTGCFDCPFAGVDPYSGTPEAGHGAPCHHPEGPASRSFISPLAKLPPPGCPLHGIDVLVSLDPEDPGVG